MGIWDDKKALDKLQKLRAERKSDRLTFDCLNLKFEGDRAYCSKGKRLGQAEDGSISLLMVLRGITSGTCRNCWDFTTEEEGEH